MSIQMNPCKSSQVSHYGYDAQSKTMAVQFTNGGLYHYHDVTPETYDAMTKAESVGKFIGQRIKGKHKYSKIGAEK